MVLCIFMAESLFTNLARHLRDNHCSQEGGSFVCHYGYNGVCSSLPVEGVSDKDYEDHVLKHHTKSQDVKDLGWFPEFIYNAIFYLISHKPHI